MLGPEIIHARSTRILRVHGQYAHEDVPASHWCVTREDLHKLRSAVEEAIKLGHIAPTESDPFDIHDFVYGPNIHTIVQQFMRRICSLTGGSGWALVQHPEGLKCDLFVTHSWSEGVFEFIDKVLNSWPSSTKHAYCCMLSNPQTFDIAHMIASPSRSPFAEALRSSTHVLVVPNRQESIYGRSWCAYEAFLAYKWNKTLLVASAPVKGIWREVLLLATSSVLGIVSHLLYFPEGFQGLGENQKHMESAFAGIANVLMLISLAMSSSPVLKVVNLCGTLVASGLFAIRARFPTGKLHADIYVLSCLCCSASLFVASQFDALNYDQEHIEKEQLRRGYSGRIVDSKSSVEEDKIRILEEIRTYDEEARVDEAIEVLLRTGMCTRGLREAHERGVKMRNAGVLRFKFLACGLETWTTCWYVHGMDKGYMRTRTWLFPSLMIAWILIFLCNHSHRERQAFLVTTLWRLVALPVFALYQVISICQVLGLEDEDEEGRKGGVGHLFALWANISLPLGFLAVIMATHDIVSVVSWPIIGVYIAKLITHSCNRRCIFSCCRHEDPSLRTTTEIELA